MATGAADGLLRSVFEGCITASDAARERRPYHRNCGCALHDGRVCAADSPCRKTVFYPIRRCWSGSHLVAAGSAPSSPSATPSADPVDAKRIARSRSNAEGLADLDR